MDKDYKTICDICGRKTWYEKEQQCQCSYPKEKTCRTCGHTEQLKKIVQCTGTLRLIDNSDLDKRFTSFYKTGERIEVTYKDKTKERFYIGKSTGWKPTYLEIMKRNSTGGSALCSKRIIDIKGLGIYNK